MTTNICGEEIPQNIVDFVNLNKDIISSVFLSEKGDSSRVDRGHMLVIDPDYNKLIVIKRLEFINSAKDSDIDSGIISQLTRDPIKLPGADYCFWLVVADPDPNSEWLYPIEYNLFPNLKVN